MEPRIVFLKPKSIDNIHHQKASTLAYLNYPVCASNDNSATDKCHADFPMTISTTADEIDFGIESHPSAVPGNGVVQVHGEGNGSFMHRKYQYWILIDMHAGSEG